MSSIVFYLNRFFTFLTDLILLPFRSLDPIWGLIVISAISGIALIYIYGLVSNQKAIKTVKRRISASILEVILYRHDIGLCLKAQGHMLLSGARYFALAVPPLLILMVPCIFVLSQLNLRYENRALQPNENAILTATVSDQQKMMEVNLETSDGLIQTPAVRSPDIKEVSWRLTPVKEGDQKFVIKLPGGVSAFESPVYVGRHQGPLYASNFSSWAWSFLYPGREKLDPAKYGLTSISLSYPKEENVILGVELHWIIIFFLVSLISGLVASRFLKVEI